MVAIKPDLFMSVEDSRESIAHLYNSIMEGENMDRVDRIYFPAQPSSWCRRREEEQVFHLLKLRSQR